jgi:hypothetical protein
MWGEMMRITLVFVLSALVSISLMGCDGSGPNHRLTIELFNLAGGGVSIVEGDSGYVVAVEEGFASEPLVVIGKEDIESMEQPEGSPSTVRVTLVAGDVLTGLARLAEADTEVVFRLTTDDAVFWGFVQFVPPSHTLTPHRIGDPLLSFPQGGVEEFRFFVLSGFVTVDGVDPAAAAWEAWSGVDPVRWTPEHLGALPLDGSPHGRSYSSAVSA